MRDNIGAARSLRPRLAPFPARSVGRGFLSWLAISVPGGETRVPPARDVEAPGETRGRERAVKETAKTLLVGAVLAVLAAATVFMMVELLQ
jgi:hypothetical protein